jgi:hypothetical protein
MDHPSKGHSNFRRAMKQARSILLASCFLLLAGCTLPFLHWNTGPAPLPNTPNYSSLPFDTPTAILSPSQLPTETLTPTITRDRGWIPSPTLRPTYSPFEWTCVDDGSPDPCHRVFRDISMLPSGEGWVVGERGVILYGNGDGWTRTDSPVDLTLRRVFTLAPNDAWAVADEAYPIGPGELRTRSRMLHWNGSVWTTFSNPESLGFIVDLSFVSAKIAWGIVFSDEGSGPVYRLIRWDGTSWSLAEQAPALAAIQMISADDGWAVGALGTLLHWDGKGWSAVESPTDTDLDELAFSSAEDGWAAGNQGVILRYALGTWWVYSSLAPNPRRMAIDPDGEDGWMFGSWTRGDLVLRWDTKDWNRFNGTVPDGEVLSLDMPSAGDAWAAGWIPGISRAGMIWHWNGASWKREFGNVPLPFQAVSFLSGNDVWGVGDGGLLAHWDGTGWREADSPTSETLNAVAMLPSGDGWAAGEGGQVLRWDGSDWSVELPYKDRGPGTNGLYYRFNALAFPSADDGWVAGSVEGGDFSQPWISHWDGEEWTDVGLFDKKPPCKCSLYAMHFSSADDGWAVGGGDQTLILHWDGTAWKTATWPDAYRLLAVDGIAADDIWAAGVAENTDTSSNPGLIFHWDGKVWASYPVPAGTTWMDTIYMNSADDGWMAGSGLLHWTGRAWETVASPVEGVIVTLARSPDGTLWAVTDTGAVLKLGGSG